MGDPAVSEATEIVRKAAVEQSGLDSFLNSYEPDPEKPTTHILVWDHRIMVVGHTKNQAACVAISAAVQTIAAAAKALKCAMTVELYRSTKDQPVYDVVLVEGKRSRLLIAAVLSSLFGIAKTAGGSEKAGMILSDQRKNVPRGENLT